MSNFSNKFRCRTHGDITNHQTETTVREMRVEINDEMITVPYAWIRRCKECLGEVSDSHFYDVNNIRAARIYNKLHPEAPIEIHVYESEKVDNLKSPTWSS